jgi:NodT family efflux transporter outer membrane factor (OMF) lipoprotein
MPYAVIAGHVRRRGLVATAALAALFLAGCISANDKPELSTLKPAGLGLGISAVSVAPAPRWWAGFGDPQLDRLMADALSANPGLDEAMARVRAASAVIAENKAGLLPQVSATSEITNGRLSGSQFVPPPYAGTNQWLGSVQTNLSWTLDFAGKQRALISQARHSSDAAALDLAAARLTLTGAVAETYVNLTRAERQAAIAQAFVDSRQKSLALVRVRSRTGLADDFDLRVSETLVAEAEQSLTRAQGERALLTHALAALAGRGADAYPEIGPSALSLDAVLPLPAQLPANLLERRPDVIAARARTNAALAGRRAAYADFFPTVDLRAFAGFSSVGLGSLLTGNALTYGGGPAVSVPIFQGGRLKARYREATAEADVATAAYNDLAVQAVKQAADALSAVETNAADSAEQRRITEGFSQTERLSRVRLQTGLAPQTDVLSAADRVLQAQLQQAGLDAEGAVRRIQLLVAVGGDFTPPPARLAAIPSSAIHR